jgi:hypothetical protein
MSQLPAVQSLHANLPPNPADYYEGRAFGLPQHYELAAWYPGSLGWERQQIAVNTGHPYQKKFAKFLTKGGWEIESTGRTQQAMGFGKQTYMLRRAITPDSRKGRAIIAGQRRAAQAAADKANAIARYENGIDDGKLTVRNLMLRAKARRAAKKVQR